MEIQQSAEVEALEIIFSKELTDFIETKRKEWHDTNSNEILEEVGKRVTKEHPPDSIIRVIFLIYGI